MYACMHVLVVAAAARHARPACLPADLGASAGGPSGRHWVLDPIDGTRGFVGKRQYSVCLGLLQDGQVRPASQLAASQAASHSGARPPPPPAGSCHHAMKAYTAVQSSAI